MILELNEKEYNTIDAIGDDECFLNDFFDYSDDNYICDTISEIADSNVEVSNYHLWENAPKISEWIERAIEEGLVDTTNFDLMRCFMAGHYEYNTEVLYNNIEELIYNYAVKKINDMEIEIDDNFDIDEFESELESRLSNIDNNSKFYEIDSEIEELISEIIEQEE